METRPTEDTAVVDNVAAGRYELHLEGAVASFADYRDHGEVRTFPHTVTDPAFRGRGLADRLVRAALDDTIAAGREIDAVCWFVADVVRADETYRRHQSSGS